MIGAIIFGLFFLLIGLLILAMFEVDTYSFSNGKKLKRETKCTITYVCVFVFSFLIGMSSFCIGEKMYYEYEIVDIQTSKTTYETLLEKSDINMYEASDTVSGIVACNKRIRFLQKKSNTWYGCFVPEEINSIELINIQ